MPDERSDCQLIKKTAPRVVATAPRDLNPLRTKAVRDDFFQNFELTVLNVSREHRGYQATEQTQNTAICVTDTNGKHDTLQNS